jgi:DNA-directed RNA polymerase sigma subunit (sigma70/sigma32)
MNEQSLERVNAFLAAAAVRTHVGDVLDVTPAEIGRELGFPDALSTARAVRALIARKRLEPAQGSYRLLDARPVDASEKEAIARPPRKPKAAREDADTTTRRHGDRTAYSDMGRAVVDRLIDLGREAAELRAALRSTREETRDARQSRDEAEARARTLSERVRDLEARAEMAESNLRTLLATARPTAASHDADVPDTEMEAILGVLKKNDDVPGPDAAAEA